MKQRAFSQMIPMKCQALFSSKTIISAKVVIDALRVKSSVADPGRVMVTSPPPPPPPVFKYPENELIW